MQALEQAMLRVAKDLSYSYSDLSDELYLVNREMRAGYSWDEVLCNLSERTGVDEIKTLVDALVQVGPLGVLRVLRAYSNYLHLERQRRPKAQAIRSAIKLVPALVLFVVPPLLIATLGPAVIQQIRQLTGR